MDSNVNKELNKMKEELNKNIEKIIHFRPLGETFFVMLSKPLKDSLLTTVKILSARLVFLFPYFECFLNVKLQH